MHGVADRADAPVLYSVEAHEHQDLLSEHCINKVIKKTYFKYVLNCSAPACRNGGNFAPAFKRLMLAKLYRLCMAPELASVRREEELTMEETTKLLNKADSTGFLDAGQMYMFHPQPYFTRLTICRTRSTDEPGVYIKRKAALAVLERVGSWRYIHCAGFNGWINVSEDQKGSKIFAHAPTLRRYEDWPGNNIFLFGGRLMIGADARFFLFTNMTTAIVVYIFFGYMAPATPRPALVSVCVLGSLRKFVFLFTVHLFACW
jgi:hypothetical protein